VRATLCRRANQPNAGAIGIELRAASSANRAGTVDTGLAMQCSRVEPRCREARSGSSPVLGEQIRYSVVSGREVNGIAFNQVAINAESAHRCNEVAHTRST
jgi:hypothetical protein